MSEPIVVPSFIEIDILLDKILECARTDKEAEALKNYNIYMNDAERYIRQNFLTFDVNDEVYMRYFKYYAQIRNWFENQYRAFGTYTSKKEYLKKIGFTNGLGAFCR
jgi:hypothetical protein